MASRLELHTRLKEILGSNNVYYQPPENIRLQYPCIIYSLNNIRTHNANNTIYKKEKEYTVTLIHRDPDNEIVETLLVEKYCSLDKAYQKDNLYHYVFSIYI